MKQYAILALVCLCLMIAGCTSSVTVDNANPEITTPAPQESPTPDMDESVRLTPRLLLEALMAKGEASSVQGVYDIQCPDVAGVLESFGETQFSAFLRRHATQNNWLQINDQKLFYESTFSNGMDNIPFVVILFNEHRNGYGLVMQERGGWQCTGYFECGEVETDPDSEYCQAPEPWVRTHSAKQLDDGSIQTWLQVPGHVDSGTGRAAYDCTWYNLNSNRTDVRYITESMHLYAPFCYRITSKALEAEEFASGGHPLTIDYECRFALAPDHFWEGLGETANDIVVPLTEYFVWKDGGMAPERTFRQISNQVELQPQMLMDLAWDQFHALEKRGTRAEKEWAKQIRELSYDAWADHITLENTYGDRINVGRRKGGIQAQDFEEMRQFSTSIQMPGGAPIKLSFIDKPDRNFTLTRYDDNGNETIIPIDNGVFYAQEQKGTLFYTLETTWFFGSFTYGFKICATEDGEVVPALSEEELAAIARARDYLQRITGYDFTYSSATATLQKWKEINGSPDEWDIDLLLPHQNMLANVRFELDGQMTFYALGALGMTNDPDVSLPLLPQPQETEKLPYTEKAAYWYENLLIKRMGEIKRIDLVGKNLPGQYENMPETRTKQRFLDGSVLTSHFDQKTGRLTYFCMYPAEVLKNN